MPKMNYEGTANLRALMVVIHRAVGDGQIAIGDPVAHNSFDMRHFIDRSACGTSACAAGWAYIFGITKSCSQAGHLILDEDDIAQCSAWLWLFGTEWAERHNTPKAFIQRLDALVALAETGLGGEDFRQAINNLTMADIVSNPIEAIPECLVGRSTMTPDINKLLETAATIPLGLDLN